MKKTSKDYKYQHLERSCAYAALASMVSAYNIQLEDYDIFEQINIPYVFRYTNQHNAYIAGTMLQDRRWFNYFLNSHGLTFITRTINEQNIEEVLNDMRKKCIISIVHNNMRHAIVYIGKDGEKFTFINPHLKEIRANNYFYFTKEDLIKQVQFSVPIGFIERLSYKNTISNSSELEKSLKDLDQFADDVVQFCERKQTNEDIIDFQIRVLQALIVDTYAMMDWIGKEEIVMKLKQLRRQNERAMRKGKDLRLFDYIEQDLLIEVIHDLKHIIQNKLKEM